MFGSANTCGEHNSSEMKHEQPSAAGVFVSAQRLMLGTLLAGDLRAYEVSGPRGSPVGSRISA